MTLFEVVNRKEGKEMLASSLFSLRSQKRGPRFYFLPLSRDVRTPVEYTFAAREKEKDGMEITAVTFLILNSILFSHAAGNHVLSDGQTWLR